MFEINTNGSVSIIEFVKSIFKKISQFDFLYNRPSRYILLNISPTRLQIHLINGLFAEQEFLQNALPDVLSFLNLHKNLPIYCVLSGWEMDIKTLNLKGANILDRYLAQSHFSRGAFSNPYNVICRPAQNKDIYLFINLHDHPSLKETLTHLSTFKNVFIGFDFEETHLLKSILQINTTFLNTKTLHILFKKTEKSWQILVSSGLDLILSRNGHYEDYFNFTQEVLNTIHYLPTLGIHSELPMVLYSEREIFSRIVLAQNSIDLIEQDDIQNAIFHAKPESMIFNMFNKIKNMNFIKTSPSFKEFFYHRFFYEFPKNSFIFQLVFILFLLIGLGVQLGRIAYLEIENNQITKHINTNKQQQHGQEDQLSAQHLLAYYQKNPVIQIKELAKLLPDFLIVEKIHFEGEKTVVHLKLKNQKERDLKALASAIEKALRVKITFKKHQKDTLILTMK